MAWSSVNEQITDGTSGLAPNGGAIALVVGTSTHGTIGTPITIGKKSNLTEVDTETGERLLGYGEMPKRIKNMQKTMADVSVLAIRTAGDIAGTISNITTTGNINITLAGTPLCNSHCTVSVYTEGVIGQAEVKISLTGDIEKEDIVLIPEDGILALEDCGVNLVFPLEIDYLKSSKWTFSTTAPTSSFAVIKEAIKNALEIYTPEFVVVAQSVDANVVKQLGELSEQLFEDHKPVLFLTETSLDSSLSIGEAVSEKEKEFARIDARFVSVVCMPKSDIVSGLVAGHITKARVNQSIGATNYFAVTGYEMPIAWTNVNSRALDMSRFITLRTYAGLNNLYWTNGRTMASDKSDYRFIEVVRTVFKAIRLARRASLPYIQAPGDEIGLQNLLAEVRNAIDGMATNTPKELDSYEVELPAGQDIVNNGVRLDISLFGIPIIRKILLNFMFKYSKKDA